MKRQRRLRRLEADAELIRRRAGGETLRELARDHGVAHTTLSRYFARPDVATQLKRAEQLIRAEQRAAEARWRAEQRAGREAQRRAGQREAAEARLAARHPPAAARRPQTASASATVGRGGGDGSASVRSERAGAAIRSGDRHGRRRPSPDQEWLDTPKNRSGRAAAEARGLVRVRNPEGTVRRWVEAADAPALLEDGWLPA